MQRVSRLCLSLAVLVSGASPYADDACYHGNAGSGVLAFSSVLEGEPFEGKFSKVSVRYCGGRIEVSVATGSASVGNRDGDEAMAGNEFFHPEAWPEATWAGDAGEADGIPRRVHGRLTIRGIVRETPVTLTVERRGEGLRVHGGTAITRLDFDVGIGEFADTSFIENDVRVRFDFKLEK